MLVSGVGRVGVPQFQGPPVAKPGMTVQPRPDSAMWGNSMTGGNGVQPNPDSAMWGNSITAGTLNVMV